MFQIYKHCNWATHELISMDLLMQKANNLQVDLQSRVSFIFCQATAEVSIMKTLGYLQPADSSLYGQENQTQLPKEKHYLWHQGSRRSVSTLPSS